MLSDASAAILDVRETLTLVSTPPKITKDELISHLEMIVKRRVKADDPHVEALPAVDGQVDETTVLAFLDFLQRHPARTPGYRHADITAALNLTVWLWWTERRRELAWLRTGRAAGMFLAQLGEPFGIGKRGVLDRIDRLEALLRFDRPDEKHTREARRKAELEQIELDWLDTHRDQLLQLVDDLLAQANRYQLAGDDRLMLDELAVDATDERNPDTDDGLTPTTMTLLNLAVTELAIAEPVAALADQPRVSEVHRVLDRAARLRSDFAALGKNTDIADRQRAQGLRRRGRPHRPGRPVSSI